MSTHTLKAAVHFQEIHGILKSDLGLPRLPQNPGPTEPRLGTSA